MKLPAPSTEAGRDGGQALPRVRGGPSPPPWRSPSQLAAPWQRLYLRPEPHGQSALRLTGGTAPGLWVGRLAAEAAATGGPTGTGVTDAGTVSAPTAAGGTPSGGPAT